MTGSADAVYPFGFCVKFGSWPKANPTLNLSASVTHANGDTPWPVAEEPFTAAGDLSPNLAPIWENTSGGRAFVDEVVKEEAPGASEHFELGARSAQGADADGNPHLFRTPAWASLAINTRKHPASAPIHFADFHCHVRGTGWIKLKDALANDSPRFFHKYDLATRAASFGKTVTGDEMGIDWPSTTNDEDTVLTYHMQGVWLYKIIRARYGPGGVNPLCWWIDNILAKNLPSWFGNWL
ncbi:MAG: hypothetical protein N3A53_04080, partial [Verrucomicrobiae bacterium]|nr:hypothetical protein [Verrucomicrobiae bacterium]